MEIFAQLLGGASIAIEPMNLAYCFVGVLLGTAIGVLPGLGPTATIAMLLPTTFGLPPTTALIMLAGIYYGAQYGGSTTAILVNLPGESSSVVTALDGHKMALAGRAGQALATAAISSFVAGTLATVLIAVFSPPIAALALEFSPADYFSLMVLGLVASVVLAHGSVLRAIGMVLLGLVIGLAGTDVNTGIPRFTLGFRQLTEGVSFVALTMGMFGLASVIASLESESPRSLVTRSVRNIGPSWADLRLMLPATLRGSALGSVLGVLPGGGATLASFAAYALEKSAAREPSRFGHGAIEGVAGPEAANNAAAQTSFIPMLTLGIPSNPVMAMMIGAMLIHGIQPGPQVMTAQPALFWGLIVSMWIGNAMLLILNLPLINLWVRMISVPYTVLFPVILILCAIGVYSVNLLAFDVYVMVLFGVIGYVFYKLDCEVAPLLLGLILGPMMEENLRRALLLGRGDVSVFVTQPISLTMLIGAAALLAILVAPSIRRTRRSAFQA